MREIYYSWAIREALAEEMERDERVFLIGEDIAGYGGAFKVTEGLVDRFGKERVRNTPISENTIIGVAAGAAMCGMRPVAEIMFMDFIALAMDQIVNHAAKFHYMFGDDVKVPLTIRTPTGGGGRGYGPTHSQSFDSWFIGVPGLKVVSPSTPHDAKGLLKSAIRDDNPVLFLEHKVLYGRRGPVPEEQYTIPLGKAAVTREGTDLSIIAYARMAEEALKAAETLAQHGVSAEVVDLRSLLPLDIETVAGSVAKTGRALIVEEGVSIGGVAAEVGFRIFEEAFEYLDAPLKRLGAGLAPMPCAENLERQMVPLAADIEAAALSLLDR